jgi:hypothetical protein
VAYGSATAQMPHSCDETALNGAPEVWVVVMHEPPATQFYGKS